MKTSGNFRIYFLISMVICSCNNRRSKTANTLQVANLNSPVETCMPDTSSDARQVIPFDEAASFIYNFASAYPTFSRFNGACSELSRSALCDLADDVCKGPNCGLLLYLCYDGSRAFLAYRKEFDLGVTDNIYPVTDASPYIATECMMNFDSAEIVSLNTVKTTLRTMNNMCSYNNTTLSAGRVDTLAAAFIEKIITENETVNDPVAIPVGFFHTVQIRELMEQMDSDNSKVCRGVRFYLGFDGNASTKIRVVAFGVKKDGYNCTDSDNGYKILERSWPPRN